MMARPAAYYSEKLPGCEASWSGNSLRNHGGDNDDSSNDGSVVGGTRFITLKEGVALGNYNPNMESSTYSYIACFLQRRSRTQSWGLSVSLFEHGYLIVAAADQEKQSSATIWSCCSAVPPDPQMIFNTDVSVLNFQDYFRNLPRRGQSIPIPLPGDMVLAINGRSVSSFAKFEGIITLMRQNLELMLVFARHRDSFVQASSVGRQLNKLDVQERLFLGAKRSYQVLKNEVPRKYLPNADDYDVQHLSRTNHSKIESGTDFISEGRESTFRGQYAEEGSHSQLERKSRSWIVYGSNGNVLDAKGEKMKRGGKKTTQLDGVGQKKATEEKRWQNKKSKYVPRLGINKKSKSKSKKNSKRSSRKLEPQYSSDSDTTLDSLVRAMGPFSC